MDTRARLGRSGEDLACQHLTAAGLVVLARNWRLVAGELRGEIDVVALDPADGTLVVCEVKTRRSDRFGGPAGAVTPAKQRKIRRLAAAFLRAADLRAAHVRFDVVAIVAAPGARPDLVHLRGVF